jgi:uncharacterized protein YbjQ (UPF0145 family)
MICPDCGFNQARGDRCQQCGAVLMDKESGGGKSSGASPAPPAHKHRAHPLHDLDLTISLPGVQPEKIQAKEPAPKSQPPAEKPAPAKPPPVSEKPSPRILTVTTPAVEGRRIEAYLGLVSGAAFLPDVRVEDFTAKPGKEAELRQARTTALEKLKREAAALGAEAVVGITSSLAFGSPGIGIVLTGTAVRLQKAG